MYDGDDIDLLYVLSPHGWSTCILFVNKHTYELTISHVFGDPIGDFIEATIALLRGALDVEVVWWDEPGGNRWKMMRNSDQKHRVQITLTEFLSSYGDEITQERTLIEFEIKISHFSALVYYQMKKITALLKEKSFEKNRSGEFPYAALCNLESFFNA
ncbi:hypothetical protein H6G20_09655 [Desertifilum sp. FACHB-1129]|uniref:Uncharacterized protein n=1 Tax=Desertifilum tharense IPPAS B-1220 TaxID=1781255 RepID=A0A1E5QG13_9CYAN|nr:MULTISPECIES: hypothetical protein [Desertifilum]MDA0213700.1 hypothetical protein [Cyanobacteria bacterium FC1]MBD2311922.1 hypothetical protein [Desertifilum sp. FACHB-1129]MBD2324569.1 hypothetical protein [Desertifilum sp. FACHB-866]MBD2334660.1 hypothetical protein [Desertifilum sp. FACHB-868]OEJ73273.1 hypothetical protein BH720_20750 [Desertifilum tharense IPPAS B-1220]